ncbi:Spo0E family sporulation regulatory protein-aspartic acid phosphatase [Paenibacillus sp. 1P07SE]|uniref:Spo0E family sporulation regulatory protein-aspartic acid phosphatase n=1 Tax=Paenibacillus sp. 1P07SE TaxID=3132209 RepID=UPI0039A72304
MAYAEQELLHCGCKSDAAHSCAGLPPIRKLEDEIQQLRHKMEQTYLQEASFNTEIVIEISRKLDQKINEYMKRRRQFSG